MTASWLNPSAYDNILCPTVLSCNHMLMSCSPFEVQPRHEPLLAHGCVPFFRARSRFSTRHKRTGGVYRWISLTRPFGADGKRHNTRLRLCMYASVCSNTLAFALPPTMIGTWQTSNGHVTSSVVLYRSVHRKLMLTPPNLSRARLGLQGHANHGLQKHC